MGPVLTIMEQPHGSELGLQWRDAPLPWVSFSPLCSVLSS